MGKISPGRIYAIAIAFSSFALFLVQPLVSQAILPWFGGGNVVWSTALVFFQLVLLAGYLYAHLLTRFSPKTQILTHGVLILAALVSLPILPGLDLKPAPNAEPTMGVLFVLLMSVGLPYFLLSTTTPLLQAWFSRLPKTDSPYKFYALSNGASLLALAVYPFVLQPLFTLPHQSLVFSLVFIATAIALTMAASVFIQHAQTAESIVERYSLNTKDAIIWTVLAAIGSALFLGVSNQLTLDIAPTPFMWVIPLAVYLLSFILAFGDKFWYDRTFTALTFAFLLFTSLLFATQHRALPTAILIIPPLAMLLCGCLLCHGELSLRKPNAAGLTWFYFFLSLGGALGGMFVALAAPKLFTGYWELPIAESACLIIALGVTVFNKQSKYFIKTRPATAVAGISLVVGILHLFFLHTQSFYDNTIVVKRSPYGILRVKKQYPGLREEYLELLNGSTTHGEQYADPALRLKPTTYYGPSSGVGKIIATYKYSDPIHVGVIGLGTGTLASQADKNDQVTFYEIDPAVEKIAHDPFTYLDDSAAPIKVILGDARLSLAQQEPQGFNVLAIDAFSSDAIPVHLLTREAFIEYARHMKSDGTIAVHISNRNLDLKPVVVAIANDQNYAWREINTDNIEQYETGSVWILLSHDENRLAIIKKTPDELAHTILWTDSYSSILPLLRR